MMSCPNNGKIQHESEEDAEYVLKQMRKKYPDYDGQPYHCMYCSMWHLGRRSEKPKKKKRKRT